ncbi:N-acetylglucosamine-6-sulfatase [Lentibacillus sp. JNUCC-1]|nr:N-acetylglucosamine-6-sulfatase [Lentibacillus sp. JNUCC-1]
MYEESLRMPFIIKYPRKIQKASVTDAMALNVDFAPTLLEFAGIPVPDFMQGDSLVPILEGTTPENWRTSMYYRYWEHMSKPHKVCAHYGVRTDRYKLVYYYNEALGMARAVDIPMEPEWELFDLEKDPMEMTNRYSDPEYASVVSDLKDELQRLKSDLKDDE